MAPPATAKEEKSAESPVLPDILTCIIRYFKKSKGMNMGFNDPERTCDY
jgi:hypothetical protein